MEHIQAFRKVNREIILLYWDIGKKIVEKQEQLRWGKGVFEKRHQVVAEIPWGQNLIIIFRVKGYIEKGKNARQKIRYKDKD